MPVSVVPVVRLVAVLKRSVWMLSAPPCSKPFRLGLGLKVLTNISPGWPLLSVPNVPPTNCPEASVISSAVPAALEKLTPPVCVDALNEALGVPSLLVGSSNREMVPGP